MTTTAPATAPPDQSPPSPPRTAAGALLRNTWRGLTSMRTALILLFLLAVAALPGRAAAAALARTQRRRPVLHRPPDARARCSTGLGFFDVFATPWFAAIYLLLFISLDRLPGAAHDRAGPRPARPAGRHAAQPRPAARTTRSARPSTSRSPSSRRARARTAARLARRRGATSPGGVRTISAEKGTLREVGNLVFHLSLLGLLVGVRRRQDRRLRGPGHRAWPAAASSATPASSATTPSVPACASTAPDLEPVLRARRRLHRHLRARRAARALRRRRRLPDGGGPRRGHRRVAAPRPSRSTTRCASTASRVYLLGHGYAPRFTVTFPDGQQRDGRVQWRPVDQTTLLSEGATKIDPPGVTDEAQRRTQPARDHRPARAHLLGRPGRHVGVPGAGRPRGRRRRAARRPRARRRARRSRSSRSTGAWSTQGRLVRVARENMRPGDEITLDDGTRVRFDGVRDWVSLQVSHDPRRRRCWSSAVFAAGGPDAVARRCGAAGSGCG